MTARLTHEQWLAALENVKKVANEDDAHTSIEWCDLLGWHQERFLGFVREGLKNDWIEVLCVTRTNILGNPQKRPAYRIKEQKVQSPRKKQKKR